MAYATANDVAVRLGKEFDTEETQQVEALLADAEIILKSRIPDLDTQITEATIDQATVVMIEANAVMRVMRNPDGFTQESDGNYSYTISSAVASGLLDISDSEWALLGIKNGISLIHPKVEVPWDNVYTYDPNAW